jgi:hypothetical protein
MLLQGLEQDVTGAGFIGHSSWSTTNYRSVADVRAILVHAAVKRLTFSMLLNKVEYCVASFVL